MAFTEDLAEFFDVQQGHATSATIEGSSVDGILILREPAAGTGFEGATRALRVPAAAAPAMPADRSGLAVVIGGTSYTAHERIEANGLAWLMLHAD